LSGTERVLEFLLISRRGCDEEEEADDGDKDEGGGDKVSAEGDETVSVAECEFAIGRPRSIRPRSPSSFSGWNTYKGIQANHTMNDNEAKWRTMNDSNSNLSGGGR